MSFLNSSDEWGLLRITAPKPFHLALMGLTLTFDKVFASGNEKNAKSCRDW
jgi:hypothetical protein